MVRVRRHYGVHIGRLRGEPGPLVQHGPRGTVEVLEQARRALAGERVEPLEHRIIHRDGYTRWIRNTIV